MTASRKGRKGRKEGQEPCAQTRPRFVEQSVDYALNAVFEADLTKVDQETKPMPAKAELCAQPQPTFASFATFA